MDDFNSSGTFYEGVFTPYGDPVAAKPEKSTGPFASLSPSVQKALETAGLKTVAEAQALGKEKLIELDGIGEKSADSIMALTAE